MAVMEGREIFIANERSQEWRGWFYNWGNGKILKSLYIVGRGVLAALFYEDPLYIAYPSHFFQILSNPLLPLPCHF